MIISLLIAGCGAGLTSPTGKKEEEEDHSTDWEHRFSTGKSSDQTTPNKVRHYWELHSELEGPHRAQTSITEVNKF